MKILIAGDLHKDFRALERLYDHCIKNNINTLIQVGDLGYGFFNELSEDKENCSYEAFIKELPKLKGHDIPIMSCGGNHDNWELINKKYSENEKITILKRNTVIKMNDEWTFVFFGGTESIDSHQRIQGRDWWPEETPSTQEFNEFFNILEELSHQDTKVAVIAHDVPYFARCPLPFNINVETKAGVPCNTTSKTLEQIYNSLSKKPLVWFYGHYHKMHTHSLKGTTFICCGMHGQGYEFDLDMLTLIACY